MNIELSDADIQSMKDKVIERVSKEIEKQLMAYASRMIQNGEFVSEIKNKAASEAAKIITDKVERAIKPEEMMKRCLDSVQGRINLKVHNMLEKGIVVKFSDSINGAA